MTETSVKNVTPIVACYYNGTNTPPDGCTPQSDKHINYVTKGNYLLPGWVGVSLLYVLARVCCKAVNFARKNFAALSIGGFGLTLTRSILRPGMVKARRIVSQCVVYCKVAISSRGI